MKTSAFNRIIDAPDGRRIAFNAMTCALAEITDDFTRLADRVNTNDLENLSEADRELLEQMRYGGYVVDSETDEVKAVQYRHLNGKYGRNGFGLTIAPTMACNFACPYCYEVPQAGAMEQSVQDDIVAAVERMASRGENIGISWYGGEPLVAKNVVFDLSQRMIAIAEAHQVEYSAYIITNGYLLDEETRTRLKDDCRIAGAQITIDGPPQIHNTRRILKRGTEPTFDRIVENAREFQRLGVDVTIRVNIDKTNVVYVDELLAKLREVGLGTVSVSLGQVTAFTEACNSVSETCLCTEEYAEVLLTYQQKLHEQGFRVVGYPHYPGVKANYCCADTNSSFVVDHKGNLYKCWNDIGNTERRVGHIGDLEGTTDEKAFRQNLEYLLWTPFNFEKCRTCDILPMCMGGCPYQGQMNGGEPECERWRYNLDEVLLLTYEQSQASHAAD